MKTLSVGRYGVPVVVDDDFVLPPKHSLSISSGGFVKLLRSTGQRRASGSYIYEEWYLHRYLLDAPAGLEVWFKDRDKCNLQRENLELVEHAANARTAGPRSGRFKGVYFCKLKGRWCAQLTHNYKRHCLGYFDEEEAAASAYNQAAMRFHGAAGYVNALPEDPSFRTECRAHPI